MPAQTLLRNGADPTLVATPRAHAHMYVNQAEPTAMTRVTRAYLSSHGLFTLCIIEICAPLGGTDVDMVPTPINWAYDRGHDNVVALLKQYVNKRPEDVCSEYSSGTN